MKKIDLYIAKRFILYYLTTLIGFMTMLIVVDISGKIEFLSRDGSFIVNFFKHYTEIIPPVFNMLLPIISVAAAVFTVISLKKSNELVCILSSGISIHRVLLPMIIILALTVPIFYINSEIIVPYMTDSKPAENKQTLITTIVTPRYVSVSSADSISNSMDEARDLTITITERQTGKLVLFLYTPRVQWLPDQQHWNFRIDEIVIKNSRTTAINAELLDSMLAPLDPVLFPSPQRLVISSRVLETMSISQLELLDPSRHADIEQYSKATFPFIMFILVFMVIPFSAGQEKNISAFLGVGIALGFVFLVYGCTFLAKFMGGKGLLPPFAAGLAPFIVFGPITWFLYRRIRT